MATTYVIKQIGLDDLDKVEPLWSEMVEHHRGVPGQDWPVKAAPDAWKVRRAEYVDWLSSGTGWLLTAVPVAEGGHADGAEEPKPDGYAAVKVQVPGATWDLGPEVGELESLVVAERARGTGVGTQLIEAARALLRERGVEYWSVAVVEVNEGAVRLYERAGFQPYYRDMLGRVG